MRFRRFVLSAVLAVTLGLSSPFASAEVAPRDAEGHEWWQHAVFYEIYPRSYADSNTRKYKNETVLIALNMSPAAQKVTFDLSSKGLPEAKATTLINSMTQSPQTAGLSDLSLEPFGVYIASIASK